MVSKRLILRGGAILAAGLLAGAPDASVAAPADVSVVTRDGVPVPNAVVSLMPQSGPQTVAAEAPQTVQMIQRDTSFNPHVLAIQTGTSVEFPNEDPFRHHVYSFSDTKAFELKLYGGVEIPSVLFDKPGHAALGCNIHDEMLGHIYVVSTPYFAKTGASGTVRWPDVPDGEYTLQVWHPEMRSNSSSYDRLVRVEGTPFETSLTVDVRRLQAEQEPDFERLDY